MPGEGKIGRQGRQRPGAQLGCLLLDDAMTGPFSRGHLIGSKAREAKLGARSRRLSPLIPPDRTASAADIVCGNVCGMRLPLSHNLL